MNAPLHSAVNLLRALAEGAPVDRERLDAVREGLESLGGVRDEEERRLAEICDALAALATMDLTRRPTVHDDGSMFDAVAGSLAMLAEELEVYVQERVSHDRELETRIAERTAELRLSEERHRLLFEQSPVPITLFDPQTLQIVRVNDAASRVYGWSKEEMTSMLLSALKDADDPELVEGMRAVREDRAPSESWKGTKRHRRKDGSILEMEIVSHPLVVDGRKLVMAVGSDATERRRLEEQLRDAQKMEAVGQLAGGIAHDFNNMLAVILADAEFALDRIDPAEQAAEDVKEIILVATRAAALTKQLLTFSRRAPARRELIGLDEAVADVEKMLRRTIGEDIRFELALDQRDGLIAVDRRQLEQVVLNLAVNARDAIGGPGTIAIATRDVTLDAKAAAALALEPGDYAMLEMRDDGCGMDATTRARVFEPFFTTKGVGKGTGLGLSIVFAIATDCGAGIEVQSDPGRGTAFRLFFPRRAGAASQPKPNVETAAAKGTGETVLVVEDETRCGRS
jgi:PAS domain S-box-containing protein